MRELDNKNNEWLVIELKLCRSILGMKQTELAELTGMALPSIKRLEKKGAQPRYSSINKIRKAFRELGVVCNFDDNGEIKTSLSEELVDVINNGELRLYMEAFIEKKKRDES